MKKILIPILLCTATITNAQINKIEHFFIESPKAHELFNFFRDSFQLPVVWKFQSWPGFASGGITLGNVAFEFLSSKDSTKFGGIAFEPVGSVEAFLPELDKIGIDHDSIQSNTFINASGRTVGWATLGILNLLPAEANLFICDYKDRELVLQNRNKASDSLKLLRGGLLGIIALEEIVINSNQFKNHHSAFAKLPGASLKQVNLFSFKEGPSIRLNEAVLNGVDRLVIRVKSIEDAKNYLLSKNLLGQETSNSIYIKSEVLDGLKIELVE